jgi:hypothetical protein
MIPVILYYTEHHDALILKKNTNGQNMHHTLCHTHAALESKVVFVQDVMAYGE